MRRRFRALVGLIALDWMLRVDTAGEVGFDELEHRGRIGFFDYTATDWITVRRGLAYLDIGPDDVFVDLGSGKGRVVLMAAMHPFKRVIGVELSAKLNTIARTNVERTIQRLRCQDVELVLADAAEYELPDDVTVVFLNNPFGRGPFEAVIRGLTASQERRPRTLRILYVAPYEDAALVATGRVRRVKYWRSHLMALYELRPDSTGSS